MDPSGYCSTKNRLLLQQETLQLDNKENFHTGRSASTNLH